MIITKNQKKYTITELKNQWKLSATLGVGLVVDYNVEKDIAPTFADLERYVAESDLF
jgi:hypothetical protein